MFKLPVAMQFMFLQGHLVNELFKCLPGNFVLGCGCLQKIRGKIGYSWKICTFSPFGGVFID